MAISVNEKSNTVVFSVVKYLALALIVVFLFKISSSGRVSNADFTTVSNAVVAAADLTNMLEGDDQMIRQIYDLDPTAFDGMTLYYPSSTLGAEELLLVKLKDLSQQEAVKNVMEERISSRKDAFAGYAPEQYDQLDHGIVEVQGNYLLLIVGNDPDAVRRAFLGAL